LTAEERRKSSAFATKIASRGVGGELAVAVAVKNLTTK
jgi:hypothetical protein